jgi:hypothetical protein
MRQGSARAAEMKMLGNEGPKKVIGAKDNGRTRLTSLPKPIERIMATLCDLAVLDKRRARTTGLYVLEMKPLEKDNKGYPTGPEGILSTVRNGPEGGVYPVKEIRGDKVLSDPLEGATSDENRSELRAIKGKLLVRLKDDITTKEREELAGRGISTRRYLETEDGMIRTYVVSEDLYENSKSHKTAVYAEITPTQARSLMNMDLPVLEPQEKSEVILPHRNEDLQRQTGAVSGWLLMVGC